MEPGSPEWLHAALYACVTGLSDSCTEGRTVEVLAAWIDDANSLCFVYQYPYFDGVLGLRCNEYEDMTGAPATDPRSFGQDTADFNIGEPLGTVVEHLRPDGRGVHWWGDLDDELPTLPPSDRLRDVVARSVEAHRQRRIEKAAAPRHGVLGRLGTGPDDWYLLVRPYGGDVRLTAAEAAATDEEIKQRYNLASVTRGGEWIVTDAPPS